MSKKHFALILALVMGLSGVLGLKGQIALAAATITSPATATITSDSALGTSVSLPTLTLSEGAAGDIATGTLTWVLPSGFVLDISAPASVAYTGTGLSGSSVVNFPDNTHFSLSISSTSTAAGSVSVGSSVPLKVKASAGTPLAAAGNITLASGTISGVSASTNFGTLTQIPGSPAKLAFTTQPPATINTNTTFPATSVSVQDQSGNTIIADSGRSVTLSAVNSANPSLAATQALAGTTTANTSAGVANFTTLSYPVAESIKLSASSSALTSALSNTVSVTAAAPNPPPVITGLPNGSLVKVLGDPTIYMVVNGTLKPFTTPAIFRAHGKKFEDVREISHDTFEHFQVGKPVGNDDREDEQGDDHQTTLPTSTPASLSSTTLAALAGLPEGTVVKVPGDPTVYLVINGSLSPIPSVNVFRAWKKRFEDVKEISPAQLQSLSVGAAATYPDGTLIKGSGPTVWVVMGGDKKGIPSMDVLKRHGWSLNNVVKTDDHELSDMHDMGVED